MNEWSKLLLILAGFFGAYCIPWEQSVVRQAGLEAVLMLQDYAREHVLTCLVPAFFIAGAIASFVSQASVLKYFGAKANRVLSYSVASVSGTVLAVCSCTVLPLFAGIHTRGAGIGPATAFLYSGPAINVLAIVLTARVLGWELGLARAVGAVSFSVVAGLLMAWIFRKEDAARDTGEFILPEDDCRQRSLSQDALYLLTMVLILIFAAFARPAQDETGFWPLLFSVKWVVTGVLLVLLAIELKLWFTRGELVCWMETTWQFVKQIVPLLAMGVLAAGFLLGRPGHEALIPERYIHDLVGGNSLGANFFASIAGALMYFATLTEIPILQGLIGSGMGQGPALALLLAGPALSLPSMIALAGVMGIRKTGVYCTIVVVLSTISGIGYGWLVG